ncbi:hypothetical protein E3A20_18010, partial [Planctomyces bekefii]
QARHLGYPKRPADCPETKVRADQNSPAT